MGKIDSKSLNESIHALQTLSKSRNLKSKSDFEFKRFTVGNEVCKVAAVDGSNNNIAGINMAVTVMRSGFLIYQNGEVVKESISPLIIETLINTPNPNIGFMKKYKDYFYNLTNMATNSLLEYEKAPERLRTILEWSDINRLTEELEKGDVIIFDGSLISGTISTSREFYDLVVERAKEKGVALVGLSKDTSLTMDSVPIPSILKDASLRQGFNENWYTKINLRDVENASEETIKQIKETYFVKFVKEKPYIFRVDMVIPDNTTLEQVLSKIGVYAFSKRNLGYPRPMQKIHDKVRISHLEKEQCFNFMKRQWLKRQNPSNEYEYKRCIKEFNEMFFNFHDALDVVSNGR